VYDGERLSPTETPAEVCFLVPLIFSFSDAHSPCATQRSMEDGDVIDALLQQACAHLVSHCLRSSSHPLRSEVAYVFTHDSSIFDLERHRQCFFFPVLYLSIALSITQDNFVLNFVIKSTTSGKQMEAVLSTPSDADVR